MRTRFAGARVAPPPAAIAGAGSLLAGAVLLFWSPLAAAAVWGAFVLVCLIMPWCPRWGFFLPLVSHGPRDRPRVALTFDDGPDAATTPLLLDLLARENVPAFFFVTGERAREHPGLIRQILAGGHGIGNHSFRHDVFLMLRSSARLRQDIDAAQTALSALGIRPRLFRPPVGISNPRLGPVLQACDLACVTFSCRAWDRGNRRIRGMAARVLRRVRPGDILVFHDRTPPARQDVAAWLGEIEAALAGLRARHFAVVPLEVFLSEKGETRGRRLQARRAHPGERGVRDLCRGDEGGAQRHLRTFPAVVQGRPPRRIGNPSPAVRRMPFVREGGSPGGQAFLRSGFAGRLGRRKGLSPP